MRKWCGCCIAAERHHEVAVEQPEPATADAAVELPTEPAATAAASEAAADFAPDVVAYISPEANAQLVDDGGASLATKGIAAAADESASDDPTEVATDPGAASPTISSVAVTDVQDPDLHSTCGTTVIGDLIPQEQGTPPFAI